MNEKLTEMFGGWLNSGSLYFALAGLALFIGLLALLMTQAVAPERRMYQINDIDLSIDEGCQNFLITGGIGSGKTSAMNFLADNLTQNQPTWGGLWLDNKGNSERDLRAIFAHHGRAGDAVVLKAAVESQLAEKTYNIFEDPAFTPGMLAGAIMEVAGSNGVESDNSEFFKRQGILHIEQMILALRALQKPVTFVELYERLTDSVKTKKMVAELADSSRGKGFASHFGERYLGAPGDQYGGVVGSLTNALAPFQTPAVAEVFANPTEPQAFRFSDLEDGKVLCVSLPQIYPRERYAINALLKQLFYLYSLARYDRAGEEIEAANVLVLWLDEAQHSLRKGEFGDYKYLDRMRAAKCAANLAMQDHTSTYPSLGKDVAIVTMAQLRNRLIFSAPTFESAEISANFIGKAEKMKVSRGVTGGRTSINRTPQDEHRIKPQDITGLRNHRCHLYLANKVLRKNTSLPRCEPTKGIFPSGTRSIRQPKNQTATAT